jgi:alpha-1,2-mannosyltransferase
MPSSRTKDSPYRPAVVTTTRFAAVAAVAVAAWYDSFRVVPRSPVHGFFDLRVYRGAVLWWLADRPLYSFHLGRTHYGFTYPPFAAVVMTPLAWLTSGQATWLTMGGSALIIVVIIGRLVWPVARRHGWSPWFTVAVAVPVVFAMDPIRETLGYGQVNAVIFALVLSDVVALRRGWAWAGVGIGLATALKLTPGLFIVLLVLVRRRRAAAVATGTFLGATLLGFLVDATASRQYWTTELWDTSRVGRLDKPSNQSVLGMLARLAEPGEPDRRLWLVLAGAVLVVGMWRAVRAYRRGDDLVAVTLVGLTTCLVSPITWTHHLYWVVPALVVLLDVAAGSPGRRLRAGAVRAGVLAVVVTVPLVLSVPWYFPLEPGTPPTSASVELLGRSSFTCLLLALLFLLPTRRVSSAEPSAVQRTAPPRPGGSSPR